MPELERILAAVDFSEPSTHARVADWPVPGPRSRFTDDALCGPTSPALLREDYSAAARLAALADALSRSGSGLTRLSKWPAGGGAHWFAERWRFDSIVTERMVQCAARICSAVLWSALENPMMPVPSSRRVR